MTTITKQRKRTWLGLAGWLGLCFAVAWVGSTFSPGPWFEQLQKPAWNPPAWIFGPVWTMLYTLMGIAAWLVWKAEGFRGAVVPLTLFLTQLALNACWSWLFFGLQRPDLAFIDIVLLGGMILATLIVFWKRRCAAGALLVPYLGWVAFATALNYAIWQLNP